MRKIIKLHNKMAMETGETKQRAKLVKSKRGWLKVAMGTIFASAALFAFNVSGAVTVNADTDVPTQQTTNNNTASTDAETVAAPSNTDSNSAATTNNNTTTTDTNAQPQAATQATSDNDSAANTTVDAPAQANTLVAATQVNGSYTTPSTQNVRDAASISGNVIGQVAEGTNINYDQKQNADGYSWMHYNDNGQSAWIANLGGQATSNGLASSLPGAQYGVDVSSYQGTDMTSYAQNGAKFAMVKISEGTSYTNPNAAGQIKSAEDNGMLVGGYGYTHFGADENAAYNESSYLIKQAQAMGIPAGAYLACDYEEDASSDAQQNTTAVLAYMNNIQNNGYKALLYSGPYYVNQHLDNARIVQAHPNSLWMASYTGSGKDSSVMIPQLDGVLIWQYTDNKDGQGVDGNVSLMPLDYSSSNASTSATASNTNNQTPAQPATPSDNGSSSQTTQPATSNDNTTSNQTATQPTVTPSTDGTVTNNSGSYTLSSEQNVRTDASTSAQVTGQLQPGYTVNFNGTKDADGYTWLRYNNFAGQDRWVADLNNAAQVNNDTPAAQPENNQPATTTPTTNNNGGVYTLNGEQNVRDAASLNATVTGQLDAGYSVRYDGFTNADGYNWVHYINFAGQDRYVADLNGTTNGQTASDNNTVVDSPAQPSATPSTDGTVTNNSGSYTLSSEQNVRTDASTSAQVTGQLQSGYTVNFNGTKDADGYTWLRYNNFAGQDRWVADLNNAAQVNNDTPAAQPENNQPAATTDSSANNSTDTNSAQQPAADQNQNQSDSSSATVDNNNGGSYTLSSEQNVRTDPSTSAQVTGQLQAGYTVNYDGTKDADGYTWMHYKNASDQDRWLAKIDAPQQQDNSQQNNVPADSTTGQTVLAIAQKQIGSAYVYGGTTPAGFDCSGLVQYAYGLAGVNIPRTTDAQYAFSKHISEAEAQPGDIVFFSNGSGIYHDGIFLGNGKVLDAETPQAGVTIGNYNYYGGTVLFGRVY
ncbi:SH3 domain-containing protein [Fructilactobacillus sp. Tb1]|uniref:SH3 domain-containing protein n=1 Tax=Fructilactobacillus sp. Tb1 TaxID=3422304 RepID=UPI003D2BA0E8